MPNKAADIGRCVKMVQVQLIQTLQINVEDSEMPIVLVLVYLYIKNWLNGTLKHLLIFHVDSFPFIKVSLQSVECKETKMKYI